MARENFRHILVPTDLTSRSIKPLRLGLRLAAPGYSRLTLFHVIETIRGVSFHELEPFYRKLERSAQLKMGALAKRAGPRGVRISLEIVYGGRADQIVRFAKDRHVDLIVLASHKVSPTAAGRNWGSISYKVGILAHCPILLVK